MSMRCVGDCFPYIKNGVNIKQGRGKSGYPITRIETLSQSVFNRDRMGYADVFDLDSYLDRILEDGDILMSHINSIPYLGRSVMYESKPGERIIHGMNLLRLKADRSLIEPGYAVVYFNTVFFKAQLMTIVKKAVNQASYSISDLKKLSVPCPSLDRQKEIIGVFEALNTKRHLFNRMEKSLDELVKSRFVELFGSGNWPVEALASIADVQGGLTKNKKRDKLELQLPYLRVANVLQGELDLSEMLSIGLTEAEREKTLLQAGDMLFVEGNGSRDQIGRSAIWDGSINPCVHQNHLIRARFSERVLPVFALAYFSSPAGREQIVAKAVSTSGLFTLSTGKIKALEIPVPPLPLQQEFAAFVQQVDKLKFETQQAIDKLQMLYDSLAQEFFAIE